MTWSGVVTLILEPTRPPPINDGFIKLPPFGRSCVSNSRVPYFLVFYGFLPSRCLESEMGPQIPPASIVTKVWVLGVYNNAAE